MRLLHIISGLGTGGAESFLVALASRLQSQGLVQQVISVSSRGPNAERLEAAGIVTHALDLKGVLGLPHAARNLKAHVEAFRPDIVQGWMYHGDLFATLAQKLAGITPRLYWNIRCSDMRLDEYSLQLRLAVRLSAALSKRPQAVIVNSRAGAEIHRKSGYRPQQMIIIPNGIDTARFAPDPGQRAAVRAEFGLSDGDRVAFHVARVDPMKDHLTLFKALEELQGIRVFLAGRGTDGLALGPDARGLGERGDVARLLSAGDLIISSSAYGEGFSNAIAEGMAAGLVPIATDVGDAREIVGSTGHIVAPGDSEGLARVLASLIALPAEELSDRGAMARQRIVDNFSLDRAVARFAALYSGGA